MKWGQRAAFQRASPDQTTQEFQSHWLAASLSSSFLTSGRTPGPFLSERSRSLVTLKKTERYIYVPNQKWQADGPLLIYHTTEALTAVSPSPVSCDEEEIWAHCRSCSLTAAWCKFPTYEWLWQFRTSRYSCWYWQNRICGAIGIGANCTQRQGERRRTGSIVNIYLHCSV